MDHSSVLRKRAADRSRRHGYRDARRFVTIVGSDGCEHLWGVDGVCVYCDRRIILPGLRKSRVE